MNKMQEQVFEILMIPIEFYSEEYKEGVHYDKYYIEKKTIQRDRTVIKSTQPYYPLYQDKNGNEVRYEFPADPDMTDFACGFYEIIYKDILEDGFKIIDDNGNFVDKNFAGDTMTSVRYLQGLKDRYHCLANFWLIPMELGRTSNSDLSKTHKDTDTEDFMDRFLVLVKEKFDKYKEVYGNYFNFIEDFSQFADINFLVGSYVDKDYNVVQYSYNLREESLDNLYEVMKQRAKAIAESKYCKKLYDYFTKCGLIKNR